MALRDYKDRAFLKAIRDTEGPVASTAEVANHLDYSLSGCINRLHDMEDRGAVASKEVGNTFVWWKVEQSNELEDIYEKFMD